VERPGVSRVLLGPRPHGRGGSYRLDKVRPRVTNCTKLSTRVKHFVTLKKLASLPERRFEAPDILGPHRLRRLPRSPQQFANAFLGRGGGAAVSLSLSCPKTARCPRGNEAKSDWGWVATVSSASLQALNLRRAEAARPLRTFNALWTWPERFRPTP